MAPGVGDLSLDISRQSFLKLRLQAIIGRTGRIGVKQNVVDQIPGRISSNGLPSIISKVNRRKQIARTITNVSYVQGPIAAELPLIAYLKLVDVPSLLVSIHAKQRHRSWQVRRVNLRSDGRWASVDAEIGSGVRGLLPVELREVNRVCERRIADRWRVVGAVKRVK